MACDDEGGEGLGISEAEEGTPINIRTHVHTHTPTHLRLIVCRSAKDLALLGGDGCVAPNHACEHTAQGLNTQTEWRHIQQQDVLDVATQHTTLGVC